MKKKISPPKIKEQNTPEELNEIESVIRTVLPTGSGFVLIYRSQLGELGGAIRCATDVDTYGMLVNALETLKTKKIVNDLKDLLRC